MTYVLGISAFYHDAAAALVASGDIVAAAQEERFTRVKYDPHLPARAIDYCLREAGIRPRELDYVAFYDQPLTKFERLLETYISYAPDGFASFRLALPVWLRQKLHVRRELRRALDGFTGHILFIDHHQSHAASAFFPSPFEEAATLTLDGVGEWSTTTIGSGRGNKLDLLEHIRFPHSLGLLYSAFTYYCGFTVNSGEYKLMGLAPYGKPVYCDTIREHLLDVKADGSYHLDLSYFGYCQGLTMTGPKFDALFGGPPRGGNERITQRHMDLAASIQRVAEDIILKTAAYAWERTGRPRNLVLAGGVALNCVANGRLLREGPFEHIWIQPAAGDAGGALGAALFTWHQLLDGARSAAAEDRQKASLLGPHYPTADIERMLQSVRARYQRYDNEAELLDVVAGDIAAGRIVGWFQGKSEFGPRALGCRSILGDARQPQLQAALNLKVKFRESFRPFAPCVLREHAHEWFDVRPGEDSPYMLLVAPVLERHRTALGPEALDRMRTDPDLSARVNIPRSSVPAITHVDYSARLQTVDARHGRYYRLLQRFHEKTGCPILVNTSFNLSWEPIVETPGEAYATFMQSQMDTLVLEDCVLRKEDQPLGLTVRTAGAPAAAENIPWADPVTADPLQPAAHALVNPATGTAYPVEGGILRLFVAEEAAADTRQVTSTVQQFYEQTPFPSYDRLDSPRLLLEKSRAGIFARLLNEQISYDARVADVGCGTGQLTNFLAIAHRTVVGVDATLASLKLAEHFRATHQLDRAAFAHMNIFKPALKEAFFDYVLSMGVLHHTRDPREAFRRVGRLVRPGGFFVVGLYNRWSRILHVTRRAVYRATGRMPSWMDPRFDALSDDAERRAAWLRDQYWHPRESSHTVDEVLRWLDEDGFSFVSAIPKLRAGDRLHAHDSLFDPQPRGNPVERFLVQLGDVAGGYREGGYFIMIGRRNEEGT